MLKLNVKTVFYHFFFMAFVAYVDLFGVALGVSPDLITALDEHWKNWQKAFAAWVSPTTNGDISLSDMNNQFNICAPFVESIRLTIKNNLLITLTGTDRKNLNIPVEKPHGKKIPVTKVQPGITSVSKSSLIINLFAFDPALPTKKTKPYGAGSVGYLLAIMPVGVTPVLADYKNQIPEKKTMFQSLFTLADVGKNAWFIAYYLSPTNEKGENGEPFNTLIV